MAGTTGERKARLFSDVKRGCAGFAAGVRWSIFFDCPFSRRKL
jgi:hypothetical protein